MSSTARQQDAQPAPREEVDLSDLGTIPESELNACRADPEREAARQAALDKVRAMRRDGRLLLS